MAHTGTGFFDRKGNFFKSARDATVSDLAGLLGQIGEGESLEEIKAKLKPKKSNIPLEMLDTANTYDDKVALVRMIVADDSGRVASVLKNMIKSV